MYEHLYPDKHPERVQKTLGCLEEPVLICGHTHEQWTKRYDKKLIVNPGSVGLHFNDNQCAEYALLKWQNNQWEVELKEVYYDLQKLENKFISSGMLEECTIWAKTIIMGIKCGRNISIEF
jgi:predicted phosphodiesterase